jgi:hypothetical protein
MASPSMLAKKLTATFGPFVPPTVPPPSPTDTSIALVSTASDHGSPPEVNQARAFSAGDLTDGWPTAVVKRMHEIMFEDLNAQRKEEYDATVALYSLYERAGGVWTPEIGRALDHDTALDSHPLIISLREFCNEWRSCRRASDSMITFLQVR